MGALREIGVLFAPCVFFLLKYQEIIFYPNLHKKEKNNTKIYFNRKKLPNWVILCALFTGIVKN